MRLKKYIPAKMSIVAFLAALVLFTCKKNDDGGGNVPPPPEPLPDLTTKVSAALVAGFVTNETDAAVQNATVEIGGTTVSTDKYGYFEVRSAQVVANAATVTVNKTGYFKSVKTFIAATGKSAFFRIKMLPKTNAGSVSGAAGGTVTLSSGMAITLPAAGVVNASTNAAYTGNVFVAAQMISATDANLSRIMPGDLRGIATSGNIRLLTTYGMMAVELTGAGGELLQVATGKKATITMPIPASLQAGAPATIPLWYFDEAKGLWKEEGSATKSGSNYVGDVSHFSFWNYDVPASYVQVNCTIVNNAGQPVPGALVKITVVNNPASFSYGYTDSAGYVAGAVPNNTQLQLDVFSNSACTGSVFSQQFTTTTSNIALGTITITTTNAQATITGTVTNCSNAPVSNGYIMLQNGSTYIKKALTNTGTYSINLLLCNGTAPNVTLIGEDAGASQQSTPVAYTINAGNNTVPVIKACGVNIQEFINYTVNGTAQSYTVLGDSITLSPQNNSIGIWFTHLITGGAWGNINFSNAGIAAGSTQNLLSFTCPEIPGNSSIGTPITVNITEYGSSGQYLAGNFTGVITGPAPTNTAYNVTCSFRLRKFF